MRADGYARLPMVRMTNVGLEPGPHTLEEMIAATDDGVLMEHNRSWSIDDRRLNFQFGCEIGWEIKNGRRGRMLQNPSYTGIGPRFWSSLDMLGGRARRVAGLGHAELRQGPARARSGTPATAPRRPASPASGWGCAADEHSLELDDVVGAVLAEVRRQAGADAEAIVARGAAALALTRFANSAIHQNVADERHRGLAAPLTVDGGRTRDGVHHPQLPTRSPTWWPPRWPRPGCGRATPPGPGWPGPRRRRRPAPPTRPPRQASPADRAAGVAAFVEAAGGLSTAGYLQTSALDRRAGRHRRAARARRDHLGGVRRHRPALRRRRRGPVDVLRGWPTWTARRSVPAPAAKARAGVDAAPVDPGRYPVVLEPAAVDRPGRRAGRPGSSTARPSSTGPRACGSASSSSTRAVSLVDDPLGPGATGPAVRHRGHAARAAGAGDGRRPGRR